MSRHVSRAVCVLLAPTLAVTAFAQPPTERSSNTSGPPGLLLLVGGSMIEGRITETPTGYMVARPNGEFLIPFPRVQLTARDRDDCYRKQRRLMRPPSPVAHYRLAKWCFQHSMYEQSEAELRDALELAPNYDPGRRLLLEVERILRPEAPRHLTREPAARRTDDGYEVPESRSTAGLTRRTTETFTAKVQLLLVNSCGSVGCHGSGSETPFALQRIRFGGRNARVYTERNLAAVLRYTDRENPANSRLLQMGRQLHGGARRPFFAGNAGNRQLALLEGWLTSVARELPPESTDNGPSLVRTADATATPDVTRSLQRTSAVTEADRSTTRKPDLLDRILDEERPDAFDPNEFNRRTRPTTPARNLGTPRPFAPPSSRRNPPGPGSSSRSFVPPATSTRDPGR